MDARRQGVSCAVFIRPPLPALPSCEQKMEPIIIFVIRFSSPRFLPLRALTSGLFISVWTWIATRNRGGPSTSPSNRSGDAQRATTTTNRQCPGRNRGKTNRGTDPPRPKHLPPLALSRAARRQPPPPPPPDASSACSRTRPSSACDIPPYPPPATPRGDPSRASAYRRRRTSITPRRRSERGSSAWVGSSAVTPAAAA